MYMHEHRVTSANTHTQRAVDFGDGSEIIGLEYQYREGQPPPRNIPSLCETTKPQSGSFSGPPYLQYVWKKAWNSNTSILLFSVLFHY